MNRINELFERKKENILNIYITAGYPQLNDTMAIIESLEQNGVDIIEIGIPFSDPLADGPVIQESSGIALKNGMNIKTLFAQIKNLRDTVRIPVLLMGYLNPILQYGIEKFVQDAKAIGIDGVIIPDLPLKEFEKDFKAIFDQHDFKNILLIGPHTSEERIRHMDKISNSFIYIISSSSTTGLTGNFSIEQINYFSRIKQMHLVNPTLIGFGIGSAHSYNKACEYANGAIVGSAFIKHITGNGANKKSIELFISTIKTTVYDHSTEK